MVDMLTALHGLVSRPLLHNHLTASQECFIVTSDALNMIPNAGMYVVIRHLSDTFSNHEMILIFVLWCAFKV